MIILASTSRYRANLLRRLGLSFTQIDPQVDESLLKAQGLDPFELSRRLALTKATQGWRQNAVCIGSDQVVAFRDLIFDKPGTRDKALKTLLTLSGQTHSLITSVCIIDQNQKTQLHTDLTEITFKSYTQAQAEKVIDEDKPWDCAGSYKIEQRGISLIAKIKSEDFTAIEGLPLIQLSRMLESCGIQIP